MPRWLELTLLGAVVSGSVFGSVFHYVDGNVVAGSWAGLTAVWSLFYAVERFFK